MIAATIRTGAPNRVEKMIPMIGMAMNAPVFNIEIVIAITACC